MRHRPLLLHFDTFGTGAFPQGLPTRGQERIEMTDAVGTLRCAIDRAGDHHAAVAVPDDQNVLQFLITHQA